MNWKQLAVLGGAALIAMYVYRRKDRYEPVDVPIEETQGGDQSADPATESGALKAIEGIGPAYADRFEEAGVTDTATLVDADPEELASETDIAGGRIRSWIERADNQVAG